MQANAFRAWVQQGLIERVVISEAAKGWQAWAYGDALPDHVGNLIYEGRRRMTWATAAQARRWLREAGWQGSIIEESMKPAKGSDGCLLVA